ncbi:MAG: thermonuclease family protein [Candidatus Aenigmatarchaeota archaeon]
MNKIAFAAAILVTVSVFLIQQAAAKPSAETALVSRVIDGDTFEIGNGAEVRILGINTPEKKQPLYENASAFLKSLIGGKNVTMEKDIVDTDKYGRQLRYVFIGGAFVEEEILEKGLANAFIIPPNEKYSERLKEAEQYAKENDLGLWNSSGYYSCISIPEFNWDALGNDNENLNGESVYLKNNCDVTISMAGWTLKNSGTKIYKFGKFFLAPEQSVKIHSGCGSDSGAEFFWCGKKAIWNNNGDTLYLRDAGGLLVLSETYAGKGG